MKWYKAYTDNYSDQNFRNFFKETGHKGVACYYLLTEMCAQKIEKKQENGETKIATSFNFNLTDLRTILKLNSANLLWVLRVGSEYSLWTLGVVETKVETILTIEMPNLLKSLSKDFAKPQVHRKCTASAPPLDIDIDIDIDIDKDTEGEKEKEKEKKITPRIPSGLKKETKEAELNKKIKLSYIDAYRSRYGIDPLTQNAAFNSQVSRLRKTVGIDDAISLVKFYLSINSNSFYLQKSHAFGLLISDLETLMTQMKTGKVYTRLEFKSIEDLSDRNAQRERLNKYFSQEEAKPEREVFETSETETKKPFADEDYSDDTY